MQCLMHRDQVAYHRPKYVLLYFSEGAGGIQKHSESISIFF